MFATGECDLQLCLRNFFPMTALFKIHLLGPCPVLLPSLLPIQIFHLQATANEEGDPNRKPHPMKRGHGRPSGIWGMSPAASTEAQWSGRTGSQGEGQRAGEGMAVASVGQQALGGSEGAVGSPVSFS